MGRKRCNDVLWVVKFVGMGAHLHFPSSVADDGHHEDGLHVLCLFCRSRLNGLNEIEIIIIGKR